MPFSFGDVAVNQGEPRQIICSVIKGDEPLKISWSLQGEDLGPGPDLTTTQLGTRTSLLMISAINYRHSGTYTCNVVNPAGSTSYSTTLKVNGNLRSKGRHCIDLLFIIIFIFFRTTKDSTILFWEGNC